MKTFKCQKDPDTLPLPQQQGCLVQGVVSTPPHIGSQLLLALLPKLQLFAKLPAPGWLLRPLAGEFAAGDPAADV